MRISDWSSDVCSSDLLLFQLAGDQAGGERRRVKRHFQIGGEVGNGADMVLVAMGQDDADQILAPRLDKLEVGKNEVDAGRSEERRVGKECVSTCRSRWSAYHSKKNNNTTQKTT